MEDTSKIVELINKVVCGLNNGDIVAGKYGIKIDGYSINSDNTSLKGELCLTISKELMKEEIKGEPNVLYSTLTFILWWRIAKRYLELKRQAKRDYKKKIIYWLKHEQ